MRRVHAEAAHSVVRVRGLASACDRRTEATGFVYAPERVLLNAHAVAGVDKDLEVVLDDGRRFGARVVAFDPRADAAVLRVPGLPARPLPPAPAVRTTAVIVGYRDGKRSPIALPVTVRAGVPAETYDIYDRVRVSRQVHRFQGADIGKGMSGAPLLTGEGRVMGMVFAKDTDKAGVGYALAAGEFAPAATAGRNATRTVSHGPC